jgi:hypothetical protein
MHLTQSKILLKICVHIVKRGVYLKDNTMSFLHQKVFFMLNSYPERTYVPNPHMGCFNDTFTVSFNGKK